MTVTSHRVRALAATLVISALAAGAVAPAVSGQSFLTQVGSGFSKPVFVTHAKDSRLFVVEQTGAIKILGGGTFLDISSLISTNHSERGLLGLAFHPNYNTAGAKGFGKFYVNYTRKSDGATVIAEYSRSSGNPDLANAASARTVLVISQPYANHNGGWMGFWGNLLYIATGDGGSSGDPGNRAQNRSSLLGKILRIKPLDPDGSGPRRYSIPTSNPFYGQSGKRGEIWSFGLRNPWRCSFDRNNGTMWCADVGQNKYEEVNRHSTGKKVNYGWRLLEGYHYYKSPNGSAGALCTVDCKVLPITEYAHSSFGGGHCAVTGGYVSRRSGAALAGRYVFGDYCSGRIWSIPAGFSGGRNLPAPVADVGFLLSSFGEGSDGRLYVTDWGGGKVYRLTGS